MRPAARRILIHLGKVSGGGMSCLKVVSWAPDHLGLVISPTWVGQVVDAPAERMQARRSERVSVQQSEALGWMRFGPLAPQPPPPHALGGLARSRGRAV